MIVTSTIACSNSRLLRAMSCLPLVPKALRECDRKACILSTMSPSCGVKMVRLVGYQRSRLLLDNDPEAKVHETLPSTWKSTVCACIHFSGNVPGYSPRAVGRVTVDWSKLIYQYLYK